MQVSARPGSGRRRAARVAGATARVAAIPLALVSVAAWVASPLEGLGGCEIEPGPLTTDVGVRVASDGTITVHPGPCAGQGFRSVRLRGADGAVLWQADAPRPVDVSAVTVGEPTPPFADVVPLAAVLDPGTAYRVELSVVGTAGTNAPATADAGHAVAGGTATFRPADLAVGRVWFDSRLVTAAAFERLSCEQRGDQD